MTENATGYKINEIKLINGHYKIVKVGAFVDKSGQCYSQLRFYRASTKEIAKYGKTIL